jgi:predicted Ser/Thr protein kinase
MNNVNPIEALVNFEFYETLDEYKPEQGDFYSLVRDLLPDGWFFYRNNGVWFGCNPPGDMPLPRQGWKIHLSASLRHAKEILTATIPIFRDMQIAFKFCVDRQMLGMMNSKQWVRGGSGKFVTVYPPDEPAFLLLLEKLYKATMGFSGPYILSDRRYKDSKVVYYRYGGIRNLTMLKVDGERMPILVSPEGTPMPDIRYPYFVVPPWTKDPCGSEALPPTAERPREVLLKDGRYRVKSVLRYSNSGGVYIAEDRESGVDVVIKEARPGIESTVDSVTLLAKEFRLLNAVKEFGIAPQPIDYFQDWEHVFLVQEFLKGWSVSAFAARNNITLLTSPTVDHVRAYYDKFRTVFTQLARHIQKLHELGIIFSDLSPENLIISRETQQVWILDFEGAYQIGVDPPITLFTAGFVYADQMNGRPADFASDCFAIGAIMHYTLAPVNEIFMINPKARYTFIKNIIKDTGFPPAVGTVISQLLDKVPENRPTPTAVIEILEREDRLSAPVFETDGPEELTRYQQDVREIVRHVLGVATYDRQDRLFPSAGAVFRTNPLSLAHGACGVAYVLKTVTGTVPTPVADWILEFISHDYYLPPGLYIGLAGIAWSLAECGLIDQARAVFSKSIGHKLLYDSVDIYYGIAGWGLGALKLFSVTQDELYLDSASEAAKHLLLCKREDELGYCWAEKDVPLGFAHGASGISLFLLYLYLASGDELFLAAGQKAIAYDLGQASLTIDGDGVSWRRSIDSPQVVYPYWIYGSAGVGTALVRYYRLTGDPEYRKMLDRIFADTNRKYAVFPNHDKGLAGLGEFNLDLYQVTQDSAHFEGALRVATGISLFKVESSKGLTFPGMPLTRASCDFSTGSAGIGHFFHRLSHPEVESPFMLDYLFESKSRKEMVLTGVHYARD